MFSFVGLDNLDMHKLLSMYGDIGNINPISVGSRMVHDVNVISIQLLL